MLNEADGWWPVVGAINQALRLSSSRLCRDVYNDECLALAVNLEGFVMRKYILAQIIGAIVLFCPQEMVAEGEGGYWHECPTT
jgi:hypothetical protein